MARGVGADVGPPPVNRLAAFLVRLRQKTSPLLEVVGSGVILFLTLLPPFQVFLLYGFFDSLFSALIHKEIIQEKTGFPAGGAYVAARTTSA
jgi:hypothetical protein